MSQHKISYYLLALQLSSPVSPKIHWVWILFLSKPFLFLLKSLASGWKPPCLLLPPQDPINHKPCGFSFYFWGHPHLFIPSSSTLAQPPPHVQQPSHWPLRLPSPFNLHFALSAWLQQNSHSSHLSPLENLQWLRAKPRLLYWVSKPLHHLTRHSRVATETKWSSRPLEP